jgi:hypothetical protein
VLVLMQLRVAALYNNSQVRTYRPIDMQPDKGDRQSIVRLLTAALIIQILGQYAVLIYTFYYVGWIYGGRDCIICPHGHCSYAGEVTNEPIKGVAYQGCFRAKVAHNFWV